MIDSMTVAADSFQSNLPKPLITSSLIPARDVITFPSQGLVYKEGTSLAVADFVTY